MLSDVGPVELWATRWRRPSAAANPQGSSHRVHDRWKQSFARLLISLPWPFPGATPASAIMVRNTTSPLSARARARAREVTGNQRPWPADKVERWAIDRLIPYAKNARTHSDAQDRRDSREHQGVGLDDAGAGGRGWRPETRRSSSVPMAAPTSTGPCRPTPASSGLITVGR